jgi:hypothetical protein
MSWAVKQKLPALQKIVLLMLADRTNKDTGRCDPSIDRLAGDCGMSKTSVKNAIRTLISVGLITAIPQKIGTVNLPNQYALNTGVGHDMPGGGAQCAGGVGHDTPPNLEVKPVIKPISVDNTSSTCPHAKIIELYNRLLPELQGVIPERWSGARATHLQSRWRESPKHQTLEFWERFFTCLRNYSFYLGDNDRSWRATLGWIVQKRNFDNLIERFVHDSKPRVVA